MGVLSKDTAIVNKPAGLKRRVFWVITLLSMLMLTFQISLNHFKYLSLISEKTAEKLEIQANQIIHFLQKFEASRKTFLRLNNLDLLLERESKFDDTIKQIVVISPQGTIIASSDSQELSPSHKEQLIRRLVGRSEKQSQFILDDYLYSSWVVLSSSDQVMAFVLFVSDNQKIVQIAHDTLMELLIIYGIVFVMATIVLAIYLRFKRSTSDTLFDDLKYYYLRSTHQGKAKHEADKFENINQRHNIALLTSLQDSDQKLEDVDQALTAIIDRDFSDISKQHSPQ